MSRTTLNEFKQKADYPFDFPFWPFLLNAVLMLISAGYFTGIEVKACPACDVDYRIFLYFIL